MRQPGDYRLERWLAALFSLLFLLPVVADAQALPSGTPTLPVCHDDVTTGSPLLATEPDVRQEAPATRFELSIRVTASEGRPSC